MQYRPRRCITRPTRMPRVQALDFARPQSSPAAGPRRGFRHLEQVVPMKVGVAKETAPGERRVDPVPAAPRKPQHAGLELLVESGAGGGSALPDSAFTDAGAPVVSPDALYEQSD